MRELGTDPAVTWMCPLATPGTVPSVRRGQVWVTAGSVPTHAQLDNVYATNEQKH